MAGFESPLEPAGARTDSQAIGAAASVVSSAPASARATVWTMAPPISAPCQMREPPMASQRPSVSSGTPSESAANSSGISKQSKVAWPSSAGAARRAAPLPTRA